jgi:predicted DNA-binding transcriptional regulator AlpA
MNPQYRLLRLKQIIGDDSSNPPIEPLIPVKKSCWWQGVKDGRFPQPLRLSPKVTVWRDIDIYSFINGLEAE